MGEGEAARRSRAKPLSSLELVDEICACSPALREARRVHLESFGTLIPHVFMGQVLLRVGSCLGASHGGADDFAELSGILRSLEIGMEAGDREARNVIAVSFVGDAELETFFRALRPLLGPKVAAQVQGK